MFKTLWNKNPELKNNKSPETAAPEEIPAEENLTETPKNPMDGMSLEEKLTTLSEKKNEISDLQIKRRDFYVDAKNLEDKMTVLGLSENKRKEIREQIAAEGGEISQTIETIRKEYGLEPTPVEIYSSRFKTLEAESNRIKESLADDYRNVLKMVEDADLSYKNSHNYNALTYLQDNLKHKGYDKIKEVQEFVDVNKNPGDAKFDEVVQNFKELLKSKIEETCIYKTQGEIDTAYYRLHKVNHLWGETESTMRDAMQKEGRFSEKE